MLLAAAAVACWSMMATVVDGLWFARSGHNHAVLYIVGKFFKVLSKCLLVSILMLLSQGICISRQLCSQSLWKVSRDLWKVSRLVAPFFVACLLLEVWGEQNQSRNYTTSFVYDTWFGGVI